MKSFSKHAAVLFTILATGVFQAKGQGPGAGGGPPDKSSRFQAGYVHQFETNIDRGGDYSVNSIYGRAALGRQLSGDVFAGISLGYFQDRYDFGGSAGFGALRPWKNVNSVRLGFPVRWRIGEDWTFFAVPSLRFQGESGADFGDAVSGGAIASLSKKFGDRLTLGPGIGFISQIEDSASIFPVIAIDWKITHALSLRTGPGLGASVGPGLALHYEVNDEWSIALGSRYEKLRFRLDKNGTTPGGVGENRGVPVYAGITWTPTNQLRLSLVGGAEFGGELKLESASGFTLSSADTSTAAFLGLNAAFSF